jgi:hypothetical protein
LRLQPILDKFTSLRGCNDFLAEFQTDLIRVFETETKISEGNGIVFDGPLITYLLCEDSKDGKLEVVQVSLSQLQGSVKSDIVGASVVLNALSALEYQLLKDFILKPPGRPKLSQIIQHYSEPIKDWIMKIICTMDSKEDEIINTSVVKVNTRCFSFTHHHHHLLRYHHCYFREPGNT